MAFKTIKGSGAPDSITTFQGTSGVDSIVFEGNTENFFLGAQEANDFIAFNNVAAKETGTYSNGELRGGAGDDLFINQAQTAAVAGAQLVGTWLNGNSGNDTIGQAAAALNVFNGTIQGGQGNDALTIGNGTGTIFNGNKGNDVVRVTGAVTTSTLGGGQGNDNVGIVAGANVSSSSILLGEGNDVFTDVAGTFGTSNTIDGAAGNDRITILSTNAVVINAGDGVDTVIGGAGADTIDGGAGNDLIRGGLAADSLTGGGGANAFDYQTILGCGNAATGAVDVITDFTTGTDDLDINFANFTAGATLNVAAGSYTSFVAARTAAAAAMGANQNRYSVAAVGSGTGPFTSYLFVNSLGNANPDFVLQIGSAGAYGTAGQATTAFVAANDVI